MKLEDLSRREQELYRCACPPENPCRPEHCAQFRTYYDAIFAGKTHEQALRAVDPDQLLCRDCRVKPPGRFRRLWTFAKACWRHVRNGLPNASPADQEHRRAICRSNQCGEYNAKDDACNKCTCKLAAGVISKTAWAQETCPLKPPKWGPVKGETVWARAWRRLRGASL